MDSFSIYERKRYALFLLVHVVKDSKLPLITLYK
jgi:hypothetical protein